MCARQPGWLSDRQQHRHCIANAWELIPFCEQNRKSSPFAFCCRPLLVGSQRCTANNGHCMRPSRWTTEQHRQFTYSRGAFDCVTWSISHNECVHTVCTFAPAALGRRECFFTFSFGIQSSSRNVSPALHTRVSYMYMIRIVSYTLHTLSSNFR